MLTESRVLATVLVLVVAANTWRLYSKQKRGESVSCDGGELEPVTTPTLIGSILFLGVLLSLCLYEWLR